MCYKIINKMICWRLFAVHVTLMKYRTWKLPLMSFSSYVTLPQKITKPNAEDMEVWLICRVMYFNSSSKAFPNYEESPSYLGMFYFWWSFPWRYNQDMLQRFWKSHLHFGSTYPKYHSQGRHLSVLLWNKSGIHSA